MSKLIKGNKIQLGPYTYEIGDINYNMVDLIFITDNGIKTKSVDKNKLLAILLKTA